MTDGTGISEDVERAAAVRHSEACWQLSKGERLLAGSAAKCQIRFGHHPRPDAMVAPLAVELVAWEDVVLIRNTSATQPVYVRVFPGPERLVEPGEVFAPVRARYDIVVLGTSADFGHATVEHVLQVDAAPLRAQAVCGDRPGSDHRVIDLRTPAVAPGSEMLTRADRRMLAALCEPVLIYAGPIALPRTAEQIARRLQTSSGYVYNRLRQIRIKLATAGVPGLVDGRPEGTRSGDRDFAQPLAAWAIRAQVVTTDTVQEILSVG